MIKSVFSLLKETIRHLIGFIIYDDLDVMSPEVRQILSNPNDTQTYIQAINKIRSGEVDEITITYSKNKTLTLIR